MLPMNEPTNNPFLKSCPFCGGNAYFQEGDGKYYIACSKSGCYVTLGEAYDRDAMPVYIFGTKQDAAIAWNKRVKMTKPDKLMDEECEKAFDKWFCSEPLDNEFVNLAFKAGWTAAQDRNKHLVHCAHCGAVHNADMPGLTPCPQDK